MNLIDDIFAKVTSLEGSWVLSLISLDSWLARAAACLLTVALIAGVRLAKFSHPGHPMISIFLRHTANLLAWSIGLVISVFFAYALVGASIALICGWHLEVWEMVNYHVLAMVEGVIVGGLAGALFYYWAIPSLEIPKAAGLHKQARALKQYDPEEYFHV